MNLRTARELAKMSRQTLANKAGVSMRTVDYAEAGRDIKLSTARRFADVIGLSIEELFPDSPEEAAS